MDKQKLMHGVDEKYGRFSDFGVEIEALQKFESINLNSSSNLRSGQRRMISGFILILCLTALLGVLSFVMSSRTTQDIATVYAGPLSVRYHAFSLNVNAYKAFLASRDIALSEDGDTRRINYYIDRARESVVLVDHDFEMLKSLAGQNEALAPKLDEMEVILDRWNAMREEYIQLALDGKMADCRAGVSGPLTFMVSEMNDLIGEIASDATASAAIDYNNMLTRTKSFDIYLVILGTVIVFLGIIIVIYVQKYTKNAIKLVDEAQEEQNKILDELMIMDETLRQNLAQMESEAEILTEMKEKFANSLEAANDAIWELNLETNTFFASEKWRDITGFDPMPEYDRELFLQFICKEDRKKFADTFMKRSGYFNTQIRTNTANSSPDEPVRWLEIRGRWLDDHRMTGSVSDITEKKESEQYIEFIAYHDPITHLPNRAMFDSILADALKRSVENNSNGCVLFIDLDDFKFINDRHGHDVGDQFLFEVARRLQKSVSEKATLARFGGDEFLILVENITGQDEVRDYIDLVMDVFAAPFSIDNGLSYITASIGVALFPEDGSDVSQILKNSDAAMYESKNAGRNTFALYSRDMSEKLLRKALIGDVLHEAIDNGSVYMVYQPQVRCSDNKVIGCEALMRLKDNRLGFISPAEFIPVAEDTRLIVPLGYWAIRNVIETDLALREKGIVMGSISVNVSELQLREFDFIEQVKKIIDEYSYDASRLHFEITESILLSNIDQEIKVLNQLKRIGVKIELDDFGTGYSSLNYVRMIPLDTIKIDKCFVDEVGINSEKEGLIDLVIRLAKMLGAEVVAEGVETADQVAFFKEKDDVILQGYYYSKPLEIKDFEAKYIELNSVTQS